MNKFSKWTIVIVLCIGMPASLVAQDQTPAATANANSSSAQTGHKSKAVVDNCIWDDLGRIICEVKETDPRAVGPITVGNSSKVVIRITQKSPFDDCVLGDTKTTEIKQSDPIATILQLLAKGVSGGALPADVADAHTAISQKDPKKLTPADLLSRDLADMDVVVRNKIDDSKTLLDTNRVVAQKADTFFANPPRSVTGYKAAPSATNVTASLLEAQIDSITSEAEPSLESEQIRYGLLHDRLKDIVNKGPQDDLDKKTIPADELALNNLAGKIAALKANYDAVTAAHGQFRSILAFLKQTDNAVDQAVPSNSPFQKDLLLLPYSQQTATTPVTCSNTLTKKQSIPQITVTIAYQKNPTLSVSIGPLLSTIPKQKLGTTAISTGLDSMGKPTFKLVFAKVDSASVQIVPFAFLNVRFFEFKDKTNPAKKSVYSLHGSLGVGVNPNSGTNEPEFFVGPSFGIKNLLIQVGDHIGRFQEGFNGGFNIGDTVPANFPTTLPIHKIYRNGFGIALSYRLPL